MPHKTLVHLDRVRILDEKEEQVKKQDDISVAAAAAAADGGDGDGDNTTTTTTTTTTLVVDKSVQTVRNVEEIYPVFVDLFLLGGGSCISYADGGYGQFGSLLQRPHVVQQSHHHLREQQREAVGYTNATTTTTKKTRPASSSEVPSDVPDAMICSKRYIKRHKLQPC